MAPALRGQARTRLTARQGRALPEELPLTAGCLHCLRRVSARAESKLRTEPWKVSRSLAHPSVWATVTTQTHRLEISQRRAARAVPRLLKPCASQLPETVAPRRAEYRRQPRRLPVLSRR